MTNSAATPLPVLVNQGGGSVGDDQAKLIASLTAAAAASGLTIAVQMIEGSKIADTAAGLVAQGAKIVVVGGGDGSQSAAAGALSGTDTALGVLPLGTLNHLARDLGIAFDPAKAFAVIAAGHRRKIDLAEVNDRVFVNNSAIGLYPLMVLDRDAQQKRLGRSKRLALLVASARTLAAFRHQRLHLASGDKAGNVETPLLFVGNNDYDIAFPDPGSRATLDDGKLCVMILRKTNRRGLFGATFRALVGRSRPDDMIRVDVADDLTVDSARSQIAVAVDGETVHLAPPLIYRIRPGALTVMAPAPKTDASAKA